MRSFCAYISSDASCLWSPCVERNSLYQTVWPSGVTMAEPDNHGNWLVCAMTIVWVWSTLIFFVRVWAKITAKRWGAEDYTISIAFVRSSRRHFVYRSPLTCSVIVGLYNGYCADNVSNSSRIRSANGPNSTRGSTCSCTGAQPSFNIVSVKVSSKH